MKIIRTLGLALVLLFIMAGAVLAGGSQEATPTERRAVKKDLTGTEVATLGGGCFWCVEAVYERIDGIVDVVSGYAGGSTENPTYYEVTSGKTGHAEVVQVHFDPEKIGYDEVLELFWRAHDPTTLNRQGADVGTQYRSIILYSDDKQREIAERSKAKEDSSGHYPNPIVTEIEPLTAFYEAEDYHQDYYENNPYAGYCTFVIRPKLDKLGLQLEPVKE
jgi:peptide-methionine (S)-S-oxide reductase